MWRPTPLTSSIDTRIGGTRTEFIFQDLIGNSLHFPLAIMLLEFLLPSQAEAGLYGHAGVMLLGAVLQSYYLGTWEYEKRPRPLPGNLIAFCLCAAYTGSQVGLERLLTLPMHQVFLVYSLFNGVVQELRWRVPLERVRHLLILAESVFRSGLLAALFWVLHMKDSHHGTYDAWAMLAEHPYHVFVLLLILAYGVLVGMTNINAYRYLAVLRETATELRTYSEWFLGPELLSRSVNDRGVLNMHLAHRAVLFMDIRGFTRWSSDQRPEIVVNLVNRFFQAAEEILTRRHASKIELTGDEIMAVLETTEAAVLSAHELMGDLRPMLRKEGLDLGIGVNCGPLIEGMVGGSSLRKFSVMGDTVNTGKRLCDAATYGEILLSSAVHQTLPGQIRTDVPRLLRVKGKAEELQVYRLDAEAPWIGAPPPTSAMPAPPPVGPAEGLAERLRGLTHWLDESRRRAWLVPAPAEWSWEQNLGTEAAQAGPGETAS